MPNRGNPFIVTIHDEASGVAASHGAAPWWNLRAGAHWTTGPRYGIVRSGYPGHQVMCILRGRGVCRYQDLEWRVRAGQSVLMDLREPHAYQSDPADPWELCWAIIDGPLIAETFATLTGDSGPVVPHGDNTHIRKRFQRLFALTREQPAGAAAWIHHELCGVFAALLEARQSSVGSTATGPRTLVTPISRVLEHLRRDPTRQHALDDLAKVAGWSPSHFAHRFKAATGYAAFAYLERLRTAQAQDLLRDPNGLSIAAIGTRVGYADPAYFSRVFRRCTGVSPRVYRAAFTGGSTPRPSR
jgi:AraC family transcriptional regulator, arabinose operon regulatory protein